MNTARKIIVDERPKVLLVEDDVVNLDTLGHALEDDRYRIVNTTSGEEALRYVLAEEFAVILMDVNLPGMDGFEAAEMIRRRRRSYHTPIIFLTGRHPDTADVFRGYEVGAVDYMLKPVLPEVLKSKIIVFVDLYRKNAQIEAQREELQNLAQRSERRFYELVQDLEAIVWEGQVNHTYTFVSKRAEAILGYPTEAWLSDRHFLVRIVHPDDLAAAQEAYRHATADTRGRVIEFRARRADGTIAWMRDHIHLVQEEHGRTSHLRGVMFDVTAAKETEQRLQEQAEQLTVADRHRNEFLAMLGHELRNPLAPNSSTVELLRLRPPKKPEQLKPSVDTIARQVDHMSHLINDLLDVARITSGKIELRRRCVDLREVVDRAIETVRPQIDAERHNLATDLPQEPIFVEGDPVRLAQVVGNLLHNAIKYTEPGGKLRLSLQEEADAARIVVSDNGIGIPADMLNAIFGLFAQAPPEGISPGGLGVGLSLVQTLVELHGGRVEARSDGLGTGSEFSVHLPQLKGAKTRPSPHRPHSAADEPCRILVVDDNEDAAASLSMLLGAFGHEVEVAGDGVGALEMCASFRPDVVFLDIGMPGMNGYEVARRLRARESHQPALLVALSGYGRQVLDDHDSEDLFDRFLLKPGTLTELQDVLADIEPAPSGSPEPVETKS